VLYRIVKWGSENYRIQYFRVKWQSLAKQPMLGSYEVAVEWLVASKFKGNYALAILHIA
jgi:hypothetical protein